MKLAIFATIFAALASSGCAATPEAPGMDAALIANSVQVETHPEATMDAGMRALLETVVEASTTEAVNANKATEEKPAGKKRIRGLKNKDPSAGVTCSMCCNDDFC
jgi:hypothetical protein